MTEDNALPREVTLPQLIERARRIAAEAAAGPAPRRALLGITGSPGAGKSTIAERIAAELGASVAALAPMDGFHLDNAVLEERGSRGRKGAPDTFDSAGYAGMLTDLARGLPARPPVFDRAADRAVPGSIEIDPGVPLVITEGNYLLLEEEHWPAARSELRECWFLSPAEDIRRSRLIGRHRSFGMTAEAAREWALGTDERNAARVAASAIRADRVYRLSHEVRAG